ncbi:hypothetical protein CAL65_19740 [Alkalilimnicola ehrlichii]|uniref:Uncharacterized protein n=1 Tax=Alkalilimnicola ehrlichii TaxID=351052 RepID=A0A3E0WJW6_9GAMM|nr:hypothetical protein CAL65_19740 [Alkalilimnicola ehrlichii]
MAGVGLGERTGLVARTQIFNPRERATAYREAARRLNRAGDREHSTDFLATARAIYDADLDARGGPTELSADDAKFYSTLSTAYREAGDNDQAAAVLTSIEAFVNANLGQPYTTAYARVLTGWWQIAENSVAAAQAGELSLTEAIQDVDLLAAFARGAGIQETTARCGNHYTIKTMSTVRFSNLYAQLGLESETAQGIDDFEALRQHECTRERTQNNAYAPAMASVYASLDRLDDYQRMVDATVDNERNRESAYRELLVYQAMELALAGQVTEALVLLADNYADAPHEHLRSLTYDRGYQYLALRLLQEGDLAAGSEVLDAAWEVALSEEFWSDGTPLALIERGCAKVAHLRYDFVSQESGQAQMRTCRDHALAHYAAATVPTRLQARYRLASGFHAVNLSDELLDLLIDARALVDTLDTVEARGQQRRQLAHQAFVNRHFDLGWGILTEATADFEQLAGTALTDAEIRDALSHGLGLASTYLTGASELRRQAAETGYLSATERERVTQARQRATAILQEAGHTSSHDVVTLIEALASPSDRAFQYRSAVQSLAEARAYTAAERIARDTRHATPDRHRMLSVIARAILAEDDFPGTTLANRDSDGDGRPDFLSPLATPSELAASNLQLDPDMDGDGIPDTLDRTPLCAACDG